MAGLQVKNIPDGLYGRLRDYAAESNSTISSVVLEALERELAKADMLKRLAERPAVELTSAVAEVIRDERMTRDIELGYGASSNLKAKSTDTPEEA